MQKFHTIQEHETYLGDLHDFNGRRIALIVHKGIAVLAQCPVEKHYLFKEDFEALADTLQFTYAARVEKGLFDYNRQLDEWFDSDTIELLHDHLNLSLQMTSPH